jgi:hypothetical protein
MVVPLAAAVFGKVTVRSLLLKVAVTLLIARATLVC